jgi:hypothetical protein
MIDHTSDRIEKLESAVRRENRRRYAFYRMLQATDRVLWRLEEMNRDGVKTVSPTARAEIRKVGATMPGHVREALRDTGHVQDMLDSLFEVQERLFRWRYPDWRDWDPDSDGSLGVAG